MNISQIKEQLGIASLQLVTSKDSEGNPTEWMRHWDNDRRIAVSILKNLVADIKGDPDQNSLGLQRETRTGHQGEYTAYMIVKYTPAEDVL